MSKYERYVYEGPVWRAFDLLVEEKWYGETSAPTKEKAESNLKYQYKKECNLPVQSRLYLDPARLTKVTPAPIKLKEDALEDKEEETCQCYTQLTIF